MNIYLKVLIFILLVDGVKVLFDSIALKKARKRKQKEIKQEKANMDNISVCISAYRVEDTICGLIDSLIKAGFLPTNIHIVNDGSPDETWKSLQQVKHSINIYNEPNKNKVEALKWLAEKVTTKYMIISDSDNVFPEEFSVKAEDFEGEYTASSFNVIPFHNDSNILVELQKYEYAKNMAFSKEAKSRQGAVTCISGAIGLFETARYKALEAKHSGFFPGEDLQRTLREQAHEGNIAHTDAEIYTECPNTAKSLFKQRLFGWGPAVFHLFPAFISLLFTRKKSAQLRYDLVYEIITLLMDPFKIVSFFYLVATGNYMMLGFVYSVYLLMEFFIKKVLRNEIKFSLLLYPVYNFCTILIKPLSFFLYIKQRLSGRVQPVVLTIALFLALPFIGKAQEQEKKKDGIINLNNQLVTDFKKGGTEHAYNLNLYAGYKTWYLESDLFINPNVSLGSYYGNSYASIRYREKDISLDVFQYIPRVLKYPNNLYVNFRAVYEFRSGKNIFIGGLTFERYLNDYNLIQVCAKRETGRLEDYMFSAKYKYKRIFSVGAGINNFGYKHFAATYIYKGFNFIAAYEERFDYTNFDRLALSLGYSYKF